MGHTDSSAQAQGGNATIARHLADQRLAVTQKGDGLRHGEQERQVFLGGHGGLSGRTV
jgi:hypothetical protein